MQTTGDTQTSTLDEQTVLRTRMKKIKHKIAVISGKGGVGKTVIAVNLAIAFALQGHENRVGILDADLHGPCVPKMLGIEDQKLRVGPIGAFPALGPLGVKVASMAFVLEGKGVPVVWRGPLKMRAIQQFLSEIAWGELDFLFIDLPPGTGDEPLSVLKCLPEMDGVVIVTIPSEVSQNVVVKAITFSRQLNVPVIGVVENMSGFVCPDCGKETHIFRTGGGEKVAQEYSVPFLGSIPLDPRVCEASDLGHPFIMENPDSPASKAFMEIVEKIKTYIQEKENRSPNETGDK
ncbi:Mrp/NBP35 family ATP-binding protein [Candidatus Bathyarchaeota archaeon]|nr:Mrp/NBP35 family ATP-binding protein [Candidatus Bathyarchaeota archaeon]